MELERLPDCKFRSEEEETVRTMGLGLVVSEEEDEGEDKEERGRNETDCVGVDDKPDKDCPIVDCGKVVVSMVEEWRQLCNSRIVSSQGFTFKKSSQRANERATTGNDKKRLEKAK